MGRNGALSGPPSEHTGGAPMRAIDRSPARVRRRARGLRRGMSNRGPKHSRPHRGGRQQAAAGQAAEDLQRPDQPLRLPLQHSRDRWAKPQSRRLLEVGLRRRRRRRVLTTSGFLTRRWSKGAAEIYVSNKAKTSAESPAAEFRRRRLHRFRPRETSSRPQAPCARRRPPPAPATRAGRPRNGCRRGPSNG